MRRVMIVGQPGSGKSSLALEVGQRLGLPVVHVDHIIWAAGWVERSRPERTRLAREAEAGEAWVFEGGHSETWPSRVARADLLLWLDRPVGLRLRRVLARSWRHRGRTRPDLPDGCPETFGPRTWEFVRYVWATRRTGREACARLVAAAPCPARRLASDGEVAALLAGLPRVAS